MSRVGGIISLKVDGKLFYAKGNFEYDLGIPKRETVTGTDRVHGYKEMPKPAMISGEVTDVSGDFNAAQLTNIKNATVTLELPNEKTIILREAYYTGEGKGNTEEGNIDFKVESIFPAQVID